MHSHPSAVIGTSASHTFRLNGQESTDTLVIIAQKPDVGVHLKCYLTFTVILLKGGSTSD